MTIPLMILAVLSVIGGWVGIPGVFGGHNQFERFLDPVFNPSEILKSNEEIIPLHGGHTLEAQLAIISVLTAVLGLYIAYRFYFRKPGTAATLAERFPAAYKLLDHKYWVDEIYGRLIIAPLLAISRILLNGLVDGGIVQGSVSALAASTRGAGSLVRRVQSGNIRSYAGWLALGAAAVIAIVLFGYHGIK
jgi:NADH-quinone oxidoreductase subunit L